MTRGWLLLLVGACAPWRQPPDATTPPRIEADPPDILSADLGCDLDAQQWTLTVEVGGWGGRARSWWSTDGLYVEDHLVPSVAYAEDGTGEDYELSLSITADFREVGLGGVTAHSCGSDPSVLLAIDDLDDGVHTCLVFPGSSVSWADVPDLPDCPGGLPVE